MYQNPIAALNPYITNFSQYAREESNL